MQDDVAFAIVDMLRAHAGLDQWATGGVYIERAPQDGGRRNKYAVVVLEPENYIDHAQDSPATLAKCELGVACFGSTAEDAAEGCKLARWALDGKAGTASGIEVQRVFCPSSEWVVDEDGAMAEAQIFGKVLHAEVNFRLPVEV